MQCVVNLSNKNEEIEIVTDIDENIMNKFEDFMIKENISSEELVNILIDSFYSKLRL